MYRRPHTGLFASVFAFFLAACAATFAPDYDAGLVTGLNAANEDALVLFSTVSAGSSAAEYPALAERYAVTIGKFDALRIQAETRDVPPLAATASRQLEKQGLLASICSDPVACVNSTPGSIEGIVEDLTTMRDTHRAAGLRPDTVGLFKNAYEGYIHQAITVETALAR